MIESKTQRKPYCIIPEPVPNQGILFVDRKSRRRSGHGGNAIVQCDTGDVLAFYSITSYLVDCGYRRRRPMRPGE